MTPGPGFYVPADMCTRKCGGSNEICGDYYLMSIGNLANYKSSGTTPSQTAPATSTSAVPTPTSTPVYRGCVGDGVPRVLNSSWTYSASEMSPAFCANIARQAGRKLFAIENGGECFVGDSLSSANPSTKCNTPCTGKSGKRSDCSHTYHCCLRRGESNNLRWPLDGIRVRAGSPWQPAYPHNRVGQCLVIDFKFGLAHLHLISSRVHLLGTTNYLTLHLSTMYRRRHAPSPQRHIHLLANRHDTSILRQDRTRRRQEDVCVGIRRGLLRRRFVVGGCRVDELHDALYW